MPVLVAAAIGVGAGVAAGAVGAGIAASVIVGAGAAIVAHKTGAADWVFDNVVKPVGKAIKKVLTSDIGQFVVKAAAALTGNAWAIPLIDGAATLANGGSFGDALKSAAISYVGGKIGSTVGEVVGQSVANATGSQAAAQILGSASGKAAVALVMGQDPVQAFISGGLNAGLSAAAGWIEQETGGAWSKLPEAARGIITSGLSAALSGQEVTPELLWNAVLSTKTVTDTVSGFLQNNTGLNDNQISALTLGIQRTAAAAFGGGDVPAAILSSINQYGQNEFKNWVDNSKVGDAINNTMDKITGDYQRAQAQAEKVDAAATNHRKAVDNYNATVNAINTGVAEQERLKTVYERALQNFQANENQANADALAAAVDAYNAYVTDFNTRYEKTLKPNLDRYEAQANQYEQAFNDATAVYDVLLDDLSVSAERIDDELKPVYSELDRKFVEFMDPNFNEAEYRKIAGLKPDDDAYLHWLTTGKEQGLPTNMAAYQEEYGSYRQQIINSVLDRAGLSLTDMTNGERAAFLAEIDSRYPTLQSLRLAPTQTLAEELLTNQSIADRAAANTFVAGQTQITDDINAMLERAGIAPGLVGEYLTQEDVAALSTPRTQTAEEVVRPADITDEDIASGAARLNINDDGLLEWGRIEMNVPYWDSNLNRFVRRTYVEQGTYLDGSFILVDALSGERVDNVMRLEINPPPGLRDTMRSDPSLFIQIVGGLNDAAGAIIDTQVGQAVSEFARNIVDLAKESPALMNTAGIALEAGGELLDTFNNLALLANINPASTPLGAIARDMMALGGDMKTEEWQEAVGRMNAVMAEGEGWGKVAAVWGGFREAPVQFVAEIIGKEILQEIPVLLVSGGTGNVTKRLLAEAGQQVAQQMARRVAIGTAATLDIGESFGGAAGSAYDTAYATAVQSGMSQGEAETYARDVAISAGMISATTTLVSMGVVDGNAFERAILGNDRGGVTGQAFDWLTQRVAEGASVTWKEGVQESIEEALPTLFTETVLTQIDPERDVLGSVLQAATLGAIAGAGTAGGIYTADTVADALLRVNPTVRNIVDNGGSNPAATKAALAELGIDNEVTQNNLLSTVSDQYHSTGDISRAFSAHPDFVVGNSDILNGVLNSVGQDVTTYVNTYVDQRYVDIAEVKAAAAAEGVTLTDEQARAMVTQTSDPAATQAALYSIQQKYDPLAVTKAEAQARFNELGFNPSAAQLNQFTKQGSEADILNELSQYVDLNQVTEAEARQFFADTGYNPTDAEVAQFVKQQAETAVQKQLADYVDPRMVDIDEVRAAYETLGLARPTQADLEKLVGQYSEADLTGRAEENLPAARYNSIVEQIEKLTTASGAGPEVMEALEAVKSDLQSQMESLGFKFDEATGEMLDAIAASEERLLDAIAANEEAGMERDEAIQDALATIAEDLGTTTETLLERIGETEESLGTKVDDLATQISDVETSILERVQELEDAGATRADALDQAIADVASALGTTEESLLEQIGSTQESLAGDIAALEESLTTQISDVETSILERVQELEDAGIDRDTALQTAIDEVAGDLGTTREDLLDQIGATEESLLDQIGAVETQLGEVETALLDRVQELEDAGIARDEALQTAIDEVAGDLGTTREDLLTQIGETEQTLLDQLTEATTGLESQIGDVETTLLDRIQELEDAGVERDEALATAISEVSDDLGTTKEDLLTQIGETEQSILDQLSTAEEAFTQGLTDVATALSQQAAEYEAAGIARDEALSQAIDDVATDLGTTRADILAQIGATEENFLTALGATEEQLSTQFSQDIQFVADLIGKPARDVTQVDVDFVADLIAQQEVVSELSMAQQQYDVTGDGLINQDDFALLQEALGGADVTFDPRSAFGPATGIYAQQEQNLAAQLAAEQQTQQQIQNQTDLFTQMNTQLQTQIQTEADEARRRAFGDYLLRQEDVYGQRVDVRTPDPMRINYVYDWQSIFATPQQSSLFPSPYAEGGQVEDTTDKLLRIIGELK